ncbi:MAG: hypothetical protein WD749_00985 [Phycisphaerales bacterium]
MLIQARVAKHEDRRLEVWRIEVARIVDLEERAGQLVEIIGGYGGLEEIRTAAADGLPRLQRDAGRFRRHRAIMQAVRDLHNGLGRLYYDKAHHADCRDTSAEVCSLYDRLLVECDKVTGKRKA